VGPGAFFFFFVMCSIIDVHVLHITLMDPLKA